MNNGIESISPAEMVNHIEQYLGDTSTKQEKSTFPVLSFPLDAQEIFEECEKNLNFPVDFIGAASLFAASVAIGNSYKCQIKDGFVESAVIYLALIAPPGTNKSAPLSFAVAPLLNRDKKTYLEFKKQQKAYTKAQAMSEKKRQAEGLDELQKPVLHKNLVSDITIEALASVHEHNKRGIGMYVDELATWFKNFNRYRSGSDTENWLGLWSGKPINIDRKTSDPILITNPFVSVGGTMQNSMLVELAKNGRGQNGFIDRVSCVIPEKIQKKPWTKTGIKQGLVDRWDKIIERLLSLPLQLDDTQTPIPRILKFSPEASEILFAWQAENVKKCNEAETEAIAGLYSKLEIVAPRFALILHLFFWACTDEPMPLNHIGSSATEGALKLAEYFRNSAVKVNSIISTYNPLDKLTTNRRKLYDSLPEVFSTGEGLAIALDLGVPEDTYQKWLKREIDNLFEKLDTGKYKKML